MGRWLAHGIAALALVAMLASCVGEEEPEPLKVALLMNVGPWQLDLAALHWAVDNVNAQGGVAGGRKLELVTYDAGRDVFEIAREVTRDPSIVAAIGPNSSAQVMDTAPLFIEDEKVMLAPASTSGEVVRAFYGSRLVWRTTESDIAQVETMLRLASERGHKRVALVTGFDAYGASFFDWFGFFAAELGLEVAQISRFDQYAETCEVAMAEALATKPDMLFAVPVAVDRAVCMAESYAATPHAGTSLVFSDVGYDHALIDALGERAEGIEVLTTAPSPEVGFAEAYRAQFGDEPKNFAANMYDAVLLLAYGLELSGGEGGRPLADALVRAVDGRGETVGWNAEGIGAALSALRRGETPDLNGATGPLTYDPLVYTDLTESHYGLFRVEGGELVSRAVIATRESNTRGAGEAASQARASDDLRQDLEGPSSDYVPAQRSGLWAVVAAVSTGWENYRHQADALAQYRLLREGGVPDDRIIMIGADDVARASENPVPGLVRYQVDGPNLRKDVVYDYHPRDLSAEDLMDIVAGKASERLPHVVESGAGDNLYVYLVGHGGSEGVVIAAASASEATSAVQGESRVLSAEHLGRTFEAMFDAGRYRRTLVVVEACHGGVLGTAMHAPGVLVLSAANPHENSLGHNYDPSLRAWLADEFSFTLHRRLAGERTEPVRALYEHVYHQVAGSHVSVYNVAGFGDLDDVSMAEFIMP